MQKQRRYNFEGLIPIYCGEHKLPEMKNLKAKRCAYDGCEIFPNYNYPDSKSGLYCATHKLEGMKDRYHPSCLTPMCDTISSPKFKGYCMRCYIYTFPDQPVSKKYKTKERATSEYVVNQFPDRDWSLDCKISDGCSRRRPDMMTDLGSHVIIVEVDENQHRDYDCSCENKRLMEISKDVNHRPVVFIRFNPDDYVSKTGKVTSCWSYLKSGVCTVKSSKQKEWNDRLSVLKDTITYWISNVPERTVEVVGLWYDEV
jgi:hypothetical protein